MEIETQVMGYLSLKTALSFMTGAVVAIILLILQVKLAVLFGVLSFVLNYIPVRYYCTPAVIVAIRTWLINHRGALRMWVR